MCLYDLGVGESSVRPTAAAGAEAARTASTQFELGRVGAGTGATTNKWRGPDYVIDGGLVHATARHGELCATAIVAVNAVGDVGPQPTTSQILGGTFDWNETVTLFSGENTTIGCIVTNAKIDKIGCRLLAEAAHDGLARAVMPAHTPADGDAFVCVSNNEVEASMSDARILTAAAVESAIMSLGSPQ